MIWTGIAIGIIVSVILTVIIIIKMGLAKSISELTNKANPSLSDELLLSDNSTSPPTDKAVTVSALLKTTASYKRYVAIISQDGTAAPVIDRVLEDTIGGVGFTRTSAGVYTVTSTAAFGSVASKFWWSANHGADNGVAYFAYVSSSAIAFQTGDTTHAVSDNVINTGGSAQLRLEIRIYP